jgi:hypothetical protein
LKVLVRNSSKDLLHEGGFDVGVHVVDHQVGEVGMVSLGDLGCSGAFGMEGGSTRSDWRKERKPPEMAL